MKQSTRLLPICTLLAGAVGFLLRCWLYAGIDQNGLLPAPHTASTLLSVLSGLFILCLFLLTRKLPPVTQAPGPGTPTMLGAVGTVFGGLGVVYFSFTARFINSDVFYFIMLAAGLLAAVSMLVLAYCQMKGSVPHVILYSAVVVFLALGTIFQCRSWGAEPQLQKYLPCLLAEVFLMLTVYHQAVFTLLGRDYRKLIFCSQAALFFCCLSLQTGLFYLAMAIFLATNLPRPREV